MPASRTAATWTRRRIARLVLDPEKVEAMRARLEHALMKLHTNARLRARGEVAAAVSEKKNDDDAHRG
jgi:hypothetical protein